MSGDLWAFMRFLDEYNAKKDVHKRKKPIVNQIGGDRKITKGRLGELQFQVNPTTITYNGGMTWTEVPSPGLYRPRLQLGCGISETIDFELYVDEWMWGKRINADDFVSRLITYRDSKNATKFVLGDYIKEVVVTACEITAQSFNPDMTLREVTMKITLTVMEKGDGGIARLRKLKV